MEKYPFEYTSYWCGIVITAMVIIALLTILPFDKLGISLCDCNEVCVSKVSYGAGCSDNSYYYDCNMCRDSDAPSCHENFTSIKECCDMKAGR